MQNEDIHEINFVESFVSKIDVSVNVPNLFDDDNKKETLTFEISMTARNEEKFENMFLCDCHMKGGTEDKTISIDCSVTGVFYVKNLHTIMEDPEKRTALSSSASKIVYPYLRELVLDVSKRLPSQMILRLKPEHDFINNEPPQQKN